MCWVLYTPKPTCARILLVPTRLDMTARAIRCNDCCEKVGEIALQGSPQEKKIVASKVFGSTLFLDGKKARGCSLKPWSLIPENQSFSNLVPVVRLELTRRFKVPGF
jgi:hypothetical protein